jgi:hypothetical protein
MGRRRTRRRLVKDELNESLDHFRQAASHAANGLSAAVGPKMQPAHGRVPQAAGRFRDTASHSWRSTVTKVTPLAAAAIVGARRARARNPGPMGKEPSRAGRRRRKLFRLLATGTAVGAAGALVMRRRRQQQWDEYDPSQVLESARSGTTSMIDTTRHKAEQAMDSAAARARAKADKISTSAEKTADTVSSSAERMADKAAAAAGTGKEKTSSVADNAKRQTDRAVDKGEGLVGKAGMPSRNSRS